MRKTEEAEMEHNNFSDIDRMEIEAEKKRREEIIKKGELKRNTILFTIASCIVQVILMLVLMIALYVFAAVIFYRFLRLQSAFPIQIASPLVFVGGMIFGFMLHKKIMYVIIDKLNLYDKLQKGLADYYRPRKARNEKQGNS